MERGLSVEALKDVIKYPQFKRAQYKGEHGGTVYRFSKTADGVTLIVSAEVKNHECWIMTGFYES
jgi:hypothetical protein